MGTTNIDLISLAKKYHLHLNGVYEKDEIPQSLTQGWYIINMQNHDKGDGTHWVCFKYNENVVSVYIDSFGVVPPTEVITALHGHYIWNKMQIQDLNNEDCGLFCICAMLFWSQFQRTSNKIILDAYNKMFTKKTIVNTIIMRNFLQRRKTESGTITGGAISVGNLKEFIRDSYEKSGMDIGDYELDSSHEYGNTYHNPKTGHAVVVHRGTQGTKDWLNNLAYATGTYNYTDRYKSGKKLQEQTEAKYGKNNVSTVGHSQGSVLARKLGQNSKEIINLNPAWLGEHQTKKEHVVRSSSDPVSALLAPVTKIKSWLYPTQTKKNNTSIQSTSSNLIKEHSYDVLDRINQDKMIGAGLRKTKTNKKRIPYNWVDSKIII